jgi:hypothetical protein
MDATEWVLTLILGGILGMIGQGIRVVAGLKKIHDQALAQGKDFNALFQGSSLGLSLLIGFIAGALAIIAVVDYPPTANPSKQLIISIIGAGYAGTDFIEGFIKKNLLAAQTEKSISP